MNLDNGPNFALAYLVPVYSLDFESAKSQGNMKIRPRCASLLKTLRYLVLSTKNDFLIIKNIYFY